MWNDCTPAPTVCAHMSTHTRANVHTYVYLLGAGTVQVLLGGGGSSMFGGHLPWASPDCAVPGVILAPLHVLLWGQCCQPQPMGCYCGHWSKLQSLLHSRSPFWPLGTNKMGGLFRG